MVKRYTISDRNKFVQRFLAMEKKMGKEKARQMVVSYFSDPKHIALFAYVFMPHYFFREFKYVHYKTLEHQEIGKRIKKHKATKAYRGHGKTTIIIVLENLYEACYKIHPYVIFNSYNDSMSIDKMKLMKDEFENNDLIHYIYGNPVSSRENWNKSDLTVFGSVRFKTISTGQNPRGLLNRGSRPTKIVSDDILDDKEVRSEDQRKYALDWYKSALMNALASDGVMEVLNTPLHPDDIIENIFQKEAPFHIWDTCWISGEDENGDTVDIDWKTNDQLEEMRKDEHTYSREILGIPLMIDGGIIRFEDLRFWESLPHIGGVSTIQDIYIHADVTHTGKQTSDYFCIGAIGKCNQCNKFYLIDFILKKIDAEQQSKEIIEFYMRLKTSYNVKRITYDAVAQDALEFWIKELARKTYGVSLPIDPVKVKVDKVSHFTPHVPHFKANSIYLPSKHTEGKQALDQITAFPQKGVHDDFVDMLSGCLDNYLEDSDFIDYSLIN